MLLTSVSFSCTKDKNSEDDNMVSIKIQCDTTGVLDPYIVSFELPGIVEAHCIEYLPYPNYGGFPNAWSPHEWTIRLIMAEGTDRTKLAPIIALAPGATITPESGTVRDLTEGGEWILTPPPYAPESRIIYTVHPVIVIGDPVQIIDGVDEDGKPNYITIYPDDPRYPY